MNWEPYLRPADPRPPPGIRPEERVAVRVVLLDRDDRVMLQQIHDPGDGGVFWITPGGAIDGDEDDATALRRELREELGLLELELGPWIWTRAHVFPFARRWYFQRERFYLARHVDHEPAEPVLEDLELGVILDHRWWTLDELASSGVDFAPAALVGGTRRILADGPPDEPYDIGI